MRNRPMAATAHATALKQASKATYVLHEAARVRGAQPRHALRHRSPAACTAVRAASSAASSAAFSAAPAALTTYAAVRPTAGRHRDVIPRAPDEAVDVHPLGLERCAAARGVRHLERTFNQPPRNKT